MHTMKYAYLFLIITLVLEFKSSAIPFPATPPAIKGGYWPPSLAGSHPPSSIPTEYFTHLFYAFLEVDLTTYQLIITPLDHKWMNNFTTTIHSKSPNLKALLSIGGGNSNPSIFSNMVSNRDNRAAFIKSTITIARNYSFDGLDLDWEFPKTDSDMSNLATLFTEWRSAINTEALDSNESRIILSAAVYFAPDFFLSDPPITYPGESIQSNVDFVNPMCFDYRGGWNTTVTGAPALLYDKSSNVSTSFGISSWTKIVSPEKIVMGLPMYGRTWELKEATEHGLGAPAVGIGPGINGVLVYSEIVDYNVKNNAIEVFDEISVSTFSYAGNVWIGYDNATSIGKKVDFAKSQRLGGYFFWAVGYDMNWTLAKAASMAWDNK